VNNQIPTANSLGSVGLDWSVSGFAVDPPTVSGTFTDISNDQLVQAMASSGWVSSPPRSNSAANLVVNFTMRTCGKSLAPLARTLLAG
jgi:hypothetical protein